MKRGKISGSENEHPVVINRKLKSEAFYTSLARLHPGLSVLERRFSKVIHQPTIDRLSETSSKTVARPISLLTGGLIALVGSSLVLFMAYQYGFRYNLLLFFVLLASGYLLGLIIEAIRFFARGRRL